MEPTGNLQSEEIATTEVGAIESQKNYVPKISKEELYKTFEHISTRETRRNEEYGYSYVFAHKNWSPFHSEEEYTTADISLSMYEAGWRKALDGWDETRKTIWTHGGNEMIIFDFDFDNADAMQYMKFDSPEKLLIYLEDNSLKNFVVKNPDENNLTKLRRFVLDKCRERLPFAEGVTIGTKPFDMEKIYEGMKIWTGNPNYSMDSEVVDFFKSIANKPGIHIRSCSLDGNTSNFTAVELVDEKDPTRPNQMIPGFMIKRITYTTKAFEEDMKRDV